MRKKIILVCEECLSRNYTATKNPLNNSERMVVRKFCARCGKHTLHRETK